MMKLAIAVLCVMLLALQAKVWFSDVGRFAAADLKREVQQQAARAERVAAANKRLVAQVLALRSGTGAIEASARRDLGMIKQGEEYYVVAMQNTESSLTQAAQSGRSSTPSSKSSSTRNSGAQTP